MDSESRAPDDRTVVVAVDGSATALQAVQWAASEAALRKRALRILLSSESAPRTGLNAMEIVGGHEWVHWNGERVLSEAAALARHADADTEVTTELTSDPIIPTLVERSARLAMIVVGSHGRGVLRRALLGSVSASVSRHVLCPIAIVHRASVVGADAAGRPVVLGVDGNDPAIGSAFEEATLRRADLVAVRASEEAGGYTLSGEWQQVHAEEVAALTERLTPWACKHPAVHIEPVVACGRPGDALLERTRGAQLVIIGRSEWEALTGAVRSTRTTLLHLAECPVLVVPESHTRSRDMSWARL